MTIEGKDGVPPTLCAWVSRYGRGHLDFTYCGKPAVEKWVRNVKIRTMDPAHQKLIAVADEIFYCEEHGIDGYGRIDALIKSRIDHAAMRSRNVAAFTVEKMPDTSVTQTQLTPANRRRLAWPVDRSAGFPMTVKNLKAFLETAKDDAIVTLRVSYDRDDDQNEGVAEGEASNASLYGDEVVLMGAQLSLVDKTSK